MKSMLVTAEPVPYGVGISCEVEAQWHERRNSQAVAYAVIAMSHGIQVRVPVCPSCWVDLHEIKEGRVPPRQTQGPPVRRDGDRYCDGENGCGELILADEDDHTHIDWGN